MYHYITESMHDVWTTSVTEETLDEAPMAYKLMTHIHETVDIIEHIQPVYNFKASEYNKPHWKK